MKTSLEWLGDFVDLSGLAPRDIADKLTMAGLEVEDLHDLSGGRGEAWGLEIGVTPNRPDALSVLGLARELAALLGRPLKKPAPKVREEGPHISTLAQAAIDDPDHCFRLAARVVLDVTLGPSPDWMVGRLASAGLRPINNVVDITNYVMLELGQPLHAYDLEEISGRRLSVRAYPAGVSFTTLDGQARRLSADVNLMICDEAGPVGLAGIMGGLNSEIKPATRHILLESAAFNAATIRRASRANGLSTDASFRFERGSDPEICGLAADRAAELMRVLAGGRVAAGRLDIHPRPYSAPVIQFSPARANACLGANHMAEDMFRALRAIGLEIEGSGAEVRVRPPSWRPDLSREVDLWEEVARLLDFDRIPATLPKPPARRQDPPPAWRLRAEARELLAARGLAESITYSFINPNFADRLGLAGDSPWRQRGLPIRNPLSEEQGLLRPLLAPSLLNALKVNQAHNRPLTALFELGRVFLSNGPDRQPEERETIGGLLSGVMGPGTWLEPGRPVDFWDVKGLLESLGPALGGPYEFKRIPDPPPWYDTAEAAGAFLADGTRLGHLGRLNRQAAQAFGLKEAATYLFELDAQLILERGWGRRPFVGWSKFPPAERDLALVLDEDRPAAEVAAAMLEDKSLPLVNLLLFDLYQGS
ncbi:MAG: phenylalanine--tRNA ligase subunit beta, partial [Candidatus Adiutrix sp.]|nr:phenylalanine--tRNA ligase subunit beta [Candidatus Adiutrix sp.]